MKKVIVLLVLLSLMLVVTECKVENVEAIQPNSSQVSNVKITKDFVYNSDVYILSVGRGILSFLPNNTFIIEGDYTLSKPNGRVANGAQIPNESTVIIDKSHDLSTVVKITEGIQITGGFKYKYETLTWYKGFKQGAMIFKETTSVKTVINFKKKFKLENGKEIEMAFNGSIYIRRESIKSEEIIDGNLISGREQVRDSSGLNLKFSISKGFEISEDTRIEIIKNLSLPVITIPIGVVPLRITPSLDVDLKVSGKCSIEGTLDMNFSQVNTQLLEVRNGKWSTISKKYTQKPKISLIPSAIVTGAFQIGPSIILNMEAYKFNLTNDDFISAGGISFETYGYVNVSLNCGTVNRNNKDEANSLSGGITVKLSFYLGRVKTENEDEKLLPYSLPTLDYKTDLIDIPSFSLLCKEFVTVTDANFMALLRNKSFPIYDGTSPPNLTTPENIFFGNPTVLFESTLSSDDFNILKNHKSVKFRFTNQQNNTLKVETKRNTDRVDEITWVNILLDKSITAEITGKDGKFTIIGKCAGDSYDENDKQYVNYVMDFAISGEKVNQAVLENVHYAFRIITKVNDSHNEFLPEGAFRYFKVSPLGAIKQF